MPEMFDDRFALQHGLGALGVPHIDQYFGVWAVHEESFRSLVDRVNQINIHAHVRQNRELAHEEFDEAKAIDRPGFDRMNGGIAVVTIQGTMTKYGSSFSDGGTVRARRGIRNAVSDDAISGIMLRIDSPGGTVAGTKDLADDIATAAKQKPVHAYIEDMGASAAFWVSSQASRVTSNATALVGSIGTFAVLEDLSGAAEKLGIKVHVVRAGEFKGTGVEGTAITDSQLAMIQERVNGLNEHFLAGVATGRRIDMARVRGLADGRVHIGEEAVKLGLTDGVMSFDNAVSELIAASNPGRRRRMSTDAKENSGDVVQPAATNEPKAATLAELKAACEGADSDFILEQMEKKATVAEATKAYNSKLRADLASQKEENAKLQEKASSGGGRGVDPVGDNSISSKGDDEPESSDDFEATVAECRRKGMTQRQAFAEACRQHPEYRGAMVAQHNQRFGRPVPA